MGRRRRPIRVKIAALLLIPIVSLVAIWGFAATITIRSGQELLRIKTVYDNVIVPVRAVTSSLQHERMLSLIFLSDDVGDRTALDSQRNTTTIALKDLERKALTTGIQAETPVEMRHRLNELIQQTNRLPDLRARVDTDNFTRMQSLEGYNAIIGAAFQVYDRMRVSPDIDLVDQTRAANLIGLSRELLSQQAALLSGVLTSGRISSEEHAAFRDMVTNRAMLYSMGYRQLDDELRVPYSRVQSSRDYQQFEQVERAVVTSVRPGQPLPSEAATWDAVTKNLADTFDRISGESGQVITDRSTPLATAVLMQIAIAGGLGLVAVAASIFISIRFGRRMVAELSGLQNAALDLAQRRLPNLVTRLRTGEDVDVAAEAPDIQTGTTEEIAVVAEAFASVQHTAVDAAVGQAEMRKGVNMVFLNLARRSQSLLHRQLSMLEFMERKEVDPETLDELFAIDHLTTRMRRHAESLIILSGAVPGRGWRNPVMIFDVVRAAVEEVEDYLRVSINVPPGPALVGNAVTDVIHLVAELVENAAIFSPPHTQVEVRGEDVARGYVLEIEDRGLGMTQQELDRLNARLSEPPEFDLADSDRLGLFVVGRLAQRHGVHVSFRASPYGGTTAIVLIARPLVVAEEPSAPEEDAELENGLPKRVRKNGKGRYGQTATRSAPIGQNGKNGGQVRHLNVEPTMLAPVLTDTGPALHSAADAAAGNGVANGAGKGAGTGAGKVASPTSDDGPSRTLLSTFQSGWRRAEEETGP
ncbi:Signal transduction histidine kinase [Sinosporangium album]|uniref:histidine kinase n=1 Tax=Sinosporangium album TaxID=504805 RepID=A0A1G7UC80_9ACTN|nr:nitrate- and nitrite sensing domain-containing protein [Sinosporangium album]SDG45054.1 Signal transduction histidine kinase [Sinosporangium album]